MRRPGPALRAGLLGMAVTLVGYALFAAWLGLHARRYADARDRATATAVGVVVEDGIGGDDDVRVRWTDSLGGVHVQRFAIYDTDRRPRGADFPVAYDPDDSAPEGFPADGDETAVEDDLVSPVLLGGLAVVPLTCVWAWRGLRFRLRVRRPGRPTRGRVRFGRRPGAAVRGRRTTWLRLTAPDGSGRHWQRVMWHPALETISGEVEVVLHRAGDGSLRPAAVTLPDGTRLVPLGRLREHRPPFLVFDDEEAVRADLRDAFVLPADALARAPRPRPWRRGAVTAASGTALGALAGLLLTGGTLVPTVAVALAAGTLLVSVWALSAPQP
ncbi:hypothetical protein [Streptomyces sp. AK04-3B]|uniref:hypothetical protein n=1 Tax=Streptomyces sp. AK04-3B TaxID=3028650 RepID=UPI0029A42EFD|nr:hypothetical protein [Streptomyces sp. AK04-3B]MDX3803442.1 hypothetical protein [Streptomyces sp. AK04-3B]